MIVNWKSRLWLQALVKYLFEIFLLFLPNESDSKYSKVKIYMEAKKVYNIVAIQGAMFSSLTLSTRYC